jgi:hypothetical protein
MAGGAAVVIDDHFGMADDDYVYPASDGAGGAGRGLWDSEVGRCRLTLSNPC